MIKKVRFGDGVRNKRVRVFDSINGEVVYILAEEEKFLEAGKEYCVNPMVETDGVLGFFSNNYMFYKSKVKGKLEEEYLTEMRGR